MTPVFDEKELMERIDNDAGFLAEIVEMLASDGRALMGQVRQAAESGDAALVGTSAHTLKGMIGNFCAADAHTSAFEVEKIGKSGVLAGAPAAIESLDKHLEALIGALNQFVATKVA